MIESWSDINSGKIDRIVSKIVWTLRRRPIEPPISNGG